MHIESAQYSKSRTGSKTFSGDSIDKEKRSTATIQKYAKSILGETYKHMNVEAVDGIKNLSPKLHSLVHVKKSAVGEEEEVDWSELKVLPKKLYL